MKTSDVIVVGGGVIGTAVAYALSRDGLAVTLYERDDLAAHSSGAAAGMLLPLGEASAPGPLFALGSDCLARYPRLSDELRERSGIDCEYNPSGALHLALSDQRLEQLREKQRQFGDFALEALDAGAARRLGIPLAETQRGGLWSPREGHVRSALLVRAFATAAASLGARIETGVNVRGLCFERRSGDLRVCGVESTAGSASAAHVVLCSGPWAAACADWLPGTFQPPIEPVRGQIASLEAPRPSFESIVYADDVYLVPKRDGSVVVGATEERVGFDRRVTAAGVASLLAAAARAVPVLADATFQGAWAGLRPTTPDGLPLVGPVPGVGGLWIAAGHSRNGVLLSPITGDFISAFVSGKDPGPLAPALAPTRFGPGALPAS